MVHSLETIITMKSFSSLCYEFTGFIVFILLVTCVMSNWSDFTPCSVTCGEGTKSRSRTVEVAAPDCPDNLLEEDVCYEGDCGKFELILY